MMFQPAAYANETALRSAFIRDAHSDTMIGLVEVFGYVGNVAYEVIDCIDSEGQHFAIAGEVIEEGIE
jgi:hypothetical protein